MEVVGRKKDFCLFLTVVDRNSKSSGCFARTAVNCNCCLVSGVISLVHKVSSS